MKNKHILLVFLATVVIGFLSRRVHWGQNDTIVPLIRIDTAAVMQITIAPPGQSELLFERTDDGWALEYEDRSIPVQPAAMAPMLAALDHLQSLRRLDTERLDTLGLDEKNALVVTLLEGKKRQVRLAFGQQVLEQAGPFTYLRLGEKGDVYLVKNHLRDVFFQKIDFFRKSQVADFSPATVQSVTCTWPGDTVLLLQKNDSLLFWHTPDLSRSMPDDSLQMWLRNLAALRNLPFADDFDESRSRQTLRATIILRRSDGEPLTLRLHRLAPLELPEEMATSRPRTRRLPVAWVLHSSQNPLNYFSVADSVLFFGLQ